MKTKLFLAFAFAASFCTNAFSQTDEYGYTTVNLTTGPQYQNTVFFDFATNTLDSKTANTWDVAFYRNSAYSFGSRINDAQNIEVYEASDDPDDWNNIDLANIGNWGDPIYNPDQTEAIEDGAFEQGSATYGWGEYNGVNHHIEGTVIFVLKYPDNSYIKFMILDYFGGYTFKYSKWNGSAWGETVTKTIANGSDDAFFNYFSFTTGDKVAGFEPNKNWDLVFTRYWTFYNNIMMYRLSGAIQNSNITVAKVQPETQATNDVTAPASSAYSKNITTIGHSWKPTSGVYNDVVYYVKEGSKYYRMYFIENGGATTGNMYFKYKDITSLLGVQNVGNKASFGIYPNPTTADKNVTILFDVKQNDSNKGTTEIYDMAGKKVYETALTNQSGLYKQDINLSKLASGVYIVKITYGGVTETKKLIVK